MNSGTFTVSPFSKVASLVALVAVFPLTPGSVWATSYSIFSGNVIPRTSPL